MSSPKESIWRKIKGWKPLYWLRTHTVDRYHLVDVRGEGDYKWGWIDRDHLMFLACFKILREFVEREDPTVGLRTLEDYAYEGMSEDEEAAIKHQIKREQEVRAIYDWWVRHRAEERRACEQLWDDSADGDLFVPHPSGRGYTLRESTPQELAYRDELERLEAKDEEMLDRLMKVRGSLWT